MAFRDHPTSFNLKSDSRLRRPDGGKKKKPTVRRVRRHSIATSGGYNEAIVWLRGH